ncbi:MAG: hypothetical protein IJH78_06460 [Clostridia bacterium]|nr:hypothetical protein [Clostridia bacterium]
MSIYQKNLRRLGICLIIVSIADAILELAFYRLLQTSKTPFTIQLQSPVGICVKDGLGVLSGLLAWLLYYRKEHSRWIIRIEIALLTVSLPVVLMSSRGKMANRVDSLINATLVLMAIVLYTALQLERDKRIWGRIRDSKPSMLDLKLNDARQWFNPIEIGPKLELNEEISSVVNRYLETSKEPRPLEITVRCPGKVSDAMQATMQEVFQMYYEDEERRVNHYLERRYIRAMALVIISIVAMTVWINFSPSNDEGVTWTILSNFAAFSLWQIGSTYFERSDGYAELLRVMIAKQAKVHFWYE